MTARRAAARPGPRPLPMHIAAANLAMTSALAALPGARQGSLTWTPALAAQGRALAADLAAADPEALALAVAEAACERLETMLQGIMAYRWHPYRRRLPAPPAVWRHGSARLLDYGTGAAAVTALFVPSLINRAHILDLSARRSLLRHLAGQGIRPLLLDWGKPGRRERGYDLGDYLRGPLDGALAAAASIAGGPVALVGYCMGGTLAVAAAQNRPAAVASLALLAAPWDFHADGGRGGRLFAAGRRQLEAALERQGELPVDVLQSLFLGLDPLLALRKFAAFARLDPASDEAADFVALEEWLNDGVPLTAPAAAECLIGWYGENRPAAGCWSPAGERVDPRRIAVPSLVLVPEGDRIVPPAAALALARQLPGARVVEPAAGHIGMIVGSRAHAAVWRPLAGWLREAGASR